MRTALITFIAIVAAVLVGVLLPRWKAERLLTVALNIRIGETTVGVEHLHPAFAEFIRDHPECNKSGCVIRAGYHNTVPAFLRVARRTDFGVALAIKQGIVACVSTQMVVDNGSMTGAGATTIVDRNFEKGTFSMRRDRDQVGEPLNVSVLMSPEIQGAERDEAYQFNLACLSAIGGCRNAADLLPSIWKQTD